MYCLFYMTYFCTRSTSAKRSSTASLPCPCARKMGHRHLPPPPTTPSEQYCRYPFTPTGGGTDAVPIPIPVILVSVSQYRYRYLARAPALAPTSPSWPAPTSVTRNIRLSPMLQNVGGFHWSSTRVGRRSVLQSRGAPRGKKTKNRSRRHSSLSSSSRTSSPNLALSLAPITAMSPRMSSTSSLICLVWVPIC